MKNRIKSVFPVWAFNLCWVIGLVHIVFYGVQPYRHYRFEDLITPVPSAVLMTMALYSIYFIAGNALKLSHFWTRRRYWGYVFLSAVLIFQSFIALIGAMHSPPYWAAFIINCMFALLAHFVLYPIYVLWRKYAIQRP